MTSDDKTNQHDIRTRAVRSSLLLSLRGTAIRIIGFVGTLVLARLLTPETFGVLAIALAVSVLATALADGGLGASLMRGPQPSLDQIRSVMGFQLALSMCVVAAVLPFGFLGDDNTLIICSAVLTVPINVLRIPAYITLERELMFGRTIVSELSETLMYYAWTAIVVSIGAGTWALAIAPILRSIVGTAVLVRLSPLPILLPRFSWTTVKPILSFGIYYQGATLLNVVRQQGRDIGIGIVGGAHALGLWSLAFRLLQVPFLLFESLWRVSYPALARLLEAGEPVKSSLERAMTLGALGGGALTAIVAAAAPSGVPLVFGDTWSGATDLVAMAALGIVLSSPVSVVAIGYLYAQGEARSVFRISAIFVSVGMLTTLGGIPIIGTAAIGYGWVLQAVVGVTLLARRVAADTGVRVLRSVVPADTAAILSVVVAWFVTSGDPSWARVVIAALIPVVAMTIVAWTVERSALLALHRNFRGAPDPATVN